jgi:AAA+ superfamily predicted ATPase
MTMSPITAYLDARLLHVEALLDRLLGLPDHTADTAAAIETAVRTAHAAGVALPDAQLAARWRLGPIELDLLWLIATPAIDPVFVHALRKLDGTARDWVDPVLATRAIGRERAGRLEVLAALEPGAPLRRGLVRVAAAERLAGRDLVPASWVAGFLRGVRVVGPRLDGFATLVPPLLAPDELPMPERTWDLLPLLRGLLDNDDGGLALFGPAGLDHPRGAIVLVHGAAGSGRATMLRAVAARLDRWSLVLDAARLRGVPPSTGAEIVEAACAEAAALGELLVLRSGADLAVAGAPLVVPLARAIAAERVAVALVTESEGPFAPELEPLIVSRHAHEVRPQSIDPAHLWLVNLPPTLELGADLDIDQFARSLHLTPVQVRAATRVAVAAAGGRAIGERDLDAAARGQLVQGIGRLAELQPATVTMADLILPPEQLGQIEEVIAAARNRDLVLRKWNLRRTIKRGLSISCLFDGDPGTGKTLAAEVIAAELGLQLLRINVASIVDKFIGETEKNLTRVFDQARPDTTLLLFDEADSLFTKRTEVQHAVDRYSNMDVNVLLQLLERFEGTAVLTTNLRRGIDPAFERRIMFKVTFERPDVDQRRQIWKVMLPQSIPTAEVIDHDRLARMELSGGEIKNAVLRAAYAAAREGTALTMRHLAEAAANEAASTGRVYVDVSRHA